MTCVTTAAVRLVCSAAGCSEENPGNDQQVAAGLFPGWKLEQNKVTMCYFHLVSVSCRFLLFATFSLIL